MGDLKALRYFVQVAQLGSFSRAATVLRVTQPAVSRMVKRLEAELGVGLLHREGRGVAVTEAGEVLLSRAIDLERQSRQIWEDVRAASDTPRGPVAFGAANIVSQWLLPVVLPAFHQRFPQVRLHILEGYAAALEEWILERRIDAGLLWGRPRSADIDLSPILSVEMCLIAPPAPLPLYEGDGGLGATCTMRQVVKMPLILPALPHALRLWAEGAASRTGTRLNVTMEVDGLMLASELVRQGAGYMLMNHQAPQEKSTRSRLRSIPIRGPAQSWVLSIATLRGTKPSAAVQELGHAIRNACARMIKDGEIMGKLIGRA